MLKPKLLQVILSFLKVGTIGFGGGAALIPVIEKEIVENRGWVDKDKFKTALVVANISPGSVPVSICAIWNTKFSLLSAYFYALPGPLLYMILLTGFSAIGEAGVRFIQFASVGIIAFVMVLLFRFITKNYRNAAEEGIKIHFIIIAAIAFLLNDSRVFPFFSLSMIMLLLITFAIIIVFGGFAKSAPKSAETEKAKQKFEFRHLRNIVLFILVLVSYTAVVHLVSGDSSAWWLAGNVFTSSLVSFGGGEVYIGIANDVFVQSGFISEQFFATRIVGITSALPGPFLVSFATGIGYAFGYETFGVAMAWMFGFLGFFAAIAATAFGALLLYTFFEIFKDSKRLRLIKLYMMPVICGVLVSVALTLINKSAAVITSTGIPPIFSFAVMFAMFAVMLVLRVKFKVNDILLIIGGGTLTLLGLSLV